MNFAARLSYKNRITLAQCDEAACYHCMRHFLSAELKRWTDGGQTALCPHCGMDSVLPGPVPPDELRLAHAWGFEPSVFDGLEDDVEADEVSDETTRREPGG